MLHLLLPTDLPKGINTENTGIRTEYTAQYRYCIPVQSQPVPPALLISQLDGTTELWRPIKLIRGRNSCMRPIVIFAQESFHPAQI